MIESAFGQATSMLHEYGFQLSSREWAGLLWLAIALIFCLRLSGVRESIAGVLRIAFGRKLLAVWLLYLVWIAGFILASKLLGLWENALGKLTVVWALTAGIVLVSRSPEASNKGFFGRAVGNVVGISILVEYLMALAAFDFWVELILQPILAFLSVLLIISERRDGLRAFRAVTGAILFLLAALLIGHSLRELLVETGQINIRIHVLQVVWPILLTFWVLPLIYVLALISGYETAFLRMSLSQDQTNFAWKPRLGMILAFGLSLKWIHEAGKGGAIDLAKSESVRQAYRAGREFVSQKLSEARREREYQENLIRFAGSMDVDGEGRSLDKREFRETTRALNWLYTCQMGWYSREPKGYKGDLLARFGDDFSMHGLSPPSGITMHVSEDGQRWYAWRRTPCGRCFAIGAGGPPPDQWLYDGPRPPSDFPGLGEEWGEAPFSDDYAPNWFDKFRE